MFIFNLVVSSFCLDRLGSVTAIVLACVVDSVTLRVVFLFS